MTSVSIEKRRSFNVKYENLTFQFKTKYLKKICFNRDEIDLDIYFWSIIMGKFLSYLCMVHIYTCFI